MDVSKKEGRREQFALSLFFCSRIFATFAGKPQRDMGMIAFKRGAIANGLCSEYTSMWQNAQDKKALMDIALDANGLRYIAETSAREAWGLTPSYIVDKFGDYINGHYQRNADGYTSELYVLQKGAGTTIKSTATLFLACDGEVSVPKNRPAEIYVSCKSRLKIHCDGMCVVFLFDDSVVEKSGKGSIHVRDMRGV